MASSTISWFEFEKQPAQPVKKCSKHPTDDYVAEIATRENRKGIDKHNYGRTFFKCQQCDRILCNAKLTPLGERLNGEILQLKKQHKKDYAEVKQIEDTEERKQKHRELKLNLKDNIRKCIEKYHKQAKKRELGADAAEGPPPRKKRRLLSLSPSDSPILGSFGEREVQSEDATTVDGSDLDEDGDVVAMSRPPKRSVDGDEVKAVSEGEEEYIPQERKSSRKRKRPQEETKDSEPTNPRKKGRPSTSRKGAKQSKQKPRNNWFLALEDVPKDICWDLFEILNTNSACSVGENCPMKGRRHFHCMDVACLVEGATPGIIPVTPGERVQLNVKTPGENPGGRVTPGGGIGEFKQSNLNETYEHRWIGRTGLDIKEHFFFHGDPTCFSQGQKITQLEMQLAELEDEVRSKQIEITTSHQDGSGILGMETLSDWNASAHKYQTELEELVTEGMQWLDDACTQATGYLDENKTDIEKISDVKTTARNALAALKSELTKAKSLINHASGEVVRWQQELESVREKAKEITEQIKVEEKHCSQQQAQIERKKAVESATQTVLSRIEHARERMRDAQDSKAFIAIQKRVRRMITCKEQKHKQWDVGELVEWLEHLNPDYQKYAAGITSILGDGEVSAGGLLAEINNTVLKAMKITDSVDRQRILDNVIRVRDGAQMDVDGEVGEQGGNALGETICFVCFGGDGIYACVPCGHLCVCDNEKCREVAGSVCPKCQGPTQMLIRPQV